MPIGYIIIAIVAVLALWVMGTYNGFVRATNVADEAFSTMDVYLKKRYDAVPNLVEIVKGYAAHEKSTFEDVVAARAKALGAGSVDERIEAEQGLSRALGRLLALTEAYPELKANANFMKLQDDYQSIENEIAASRKYFNATVRDYNIKVATVPASIIAGMFGFKQRALFEIAETERENVKIAF